MRAWKVFPVEGKPEWLEVQLNKIQRDGFEIHTIMPKSFGFLVVAFMDQPFSQPPTRPASGATAGVA
jgi:hypothetical protein